MKVLKSLHVALLVVSVGVAYAAEPDTYAVAVSGTSVGAAMTNAQVLVYGPVAEKTCELLLPALTRAEHETTPSTATALTPTCG